jgi:hypothetical protein
MKKHCTAAGAGLLAIILVTSSGLALDRVRVFASPKAYMTANMKILERGFLGSLNHEVPGVVESALGEIARLKLAQPQAVSPRIAERLEELAIEGETAGIRYKASLASLVFRFPSMFQVHQYTDYATSEEVFTDIARRLEQKVLAVQDE